MNDKPVTWRSGPSSLLLPAYRVGLLLFTTQFVFDAATFRKSNAFLFEYKTRILRKQSIKT